VRRQGRKKRVWREGKASVARLVAACVDKERTDHAPIDFVLARGLHAVESANREKKRENGKSEEGGKNIASATSAPTRN